VIHDPVIVRLAAANPVPAAAPLMATPTQRRGHRRRLAALAFIGAAIAAPAAAFADEIGSLLGFSTQGTPVATSDTPFTRVSGFAEALGELGVPSTLRLLATRDGISFYAARRPDGHYCFAVDSAGRKGLGCDMGSPAGAFFPSPQRPIFDFSRFSKGERLVGFAADGVVRVALIDGSGAVIASAPVIDNVYANASPPPGAAGVEALDAHGKVVYRRGFDELP
jgi:hypothetical protein